MISEVHFKDGQEVKKGDLLFIIDPRPYEAALKRAQAALARHTLAAYPPDLLIEVPRSACRGLEFHRAAEVIETGRELAARALDTIT